MFDTHCHLNFNAFNDKVDEIIALAKSVGVNQITVPGTDIESSRKAMMIAQKHEGVYAAVGIHPHHVFDMVEMKNDSSVILSRQLAEKDLINRDSSVVLNQVEILLQNDTGSKVVAIGEIGLDRYEYKKTKYQDYQIREEFIDLQKELFVGQLQLAIKHNLSVIVHNREAKEDLLAVLNYNWDAHFEKSMVIHCCEPDLDILQFVKDHELFIGIDGDVTYSSEKQEFIKKVPLDILVLETDSPFLVPEPLRSQKVARRADAVRRTLSVGAPSGRRPNTPANIPLIAQFVADLKGESVENVARQTTQNALKLFNLT